MSQVIFMYINAVFVFECMTHVAAWWRKYKPVCFLWFYICLLILLIKSSKHINLIDYSFRELIKSGVDWQSELWQSKLQLKLNQQINVFKWSNHQLIQPAGNQVKLLFVMQVTLTLENLKEKLLNTYFNS